MSLLATYDEAGSRLAPVIEDGAEIARRLETLGVQFHANVVRPITLADARANQRFGAPYVAQVAARFEVVQQRAHVVGVQISETVLELLREFFAAVLATAEMA